MKLLTTMKWEYNENIMGICEGVIAFLTSHNLSSQKKTKKLHPHHEKSPKNTTFLNDVYQEMSSLPTLDPTTKHETGERWIKDVWLVIYLPLWNI